MANARPMNPEFPRWYRAVSMGDDRDRLARRWSGIIKAVDDVTEADVEAMVRVVFRTKSPAKPESLSRLRSAFKAADDLFEMQGNDRELQVLCGSALTTLFEQDEDIAVIAALAVTTASLGGARELDLPMDLLAAAEQAIAGASESKRKYPDITNRAPIDLPKFGFDTAVAKLNAQQDWDGVAAAITLAGQTTHAAVAQIVRKSSDALSAMANFVRIQAEELNMLWWLIGERSWDLDCSFNAVPVDAQPLVLAKELSDLTEFPPGPYSVKALLSRGGLKERKKFAVPTTINACPAAWLRQLVEDIDPSPVTCPIHFAIKRKVETGDDTSWIPGWAAAANVNQAHAISGLQLGLLFYRERLLICFAQE